MPNNTHCPTCGGVKNRNATQCKACSNVTIRQKLKGRRHTDERRRNISDAKRRQIAADGKVFDIAAHMRGRPHPFAVAVGTERVVKDGRVQVKRDDGRWLYRSRVVWSDVNGPVPHGRVIHHVNEDPMDDRLENLAMMTRAEHAAAHAALRNEAPR